MPKTFDTALIDPIADPRWRAFVERTGHASPFHHPAWLRLLKDQYDYPLAASCVLDERGQVIAGLPLAKVSSPLTGRRLVALPFSDACPPLVQGGAPADARELLGVALDTERRRADRDLEVRGAWPDLPSAIGLLRFRAHHLRLAADLGGVEGRFKPQVRRGVAKALRAGLEAERLTSVDALDAFYALHVQTRRRHGVPTQPKAFIRRFVRLFGEGLGFVLLVRTEGRPIAAAVFLALHGTLVYKYGASDADYLDRRPNNLLFREAIRWACERGFHTLDFGRTELENSGLRAFKRSWGAEESDLYYTYLPARPPAVGHSLTERALGATIRRMPAAFGRGVGEALYKHVG